MSMSNYNMSVATRTSDYRNKYNTLTPAEAKKLTRYLNGKRPIRTASVLNKPRVPPLIVDEFSQQNRKPAPVDTFNTEQHYGTLPSNMAGGRLRRVHNNSICASSCNNHSTPDQRHSLNYGRACQTNANRRYAFTYGATDPKQVMRCSPNESESNLSFRSSLDIVDSAYGSDRLQTMSVDLGNPNLQYYGNSNGIQKDHHNQLDLFQESNKLSDDSYSSAKSEQSEFNLKSASKSSLSSSTTKVFKDQFSNIKKLFRYMPSRRSFMGSNQESLKPTNGQQASQSKVDQSTLSEYISDLCLNRSQSPPVCPPPPGELKSVSYMESSVNYSNYDEFTRARNQRTSAMLNNSIRTKQPLKEIYAENNNHASNDEHDSWQLSSLPVAYERNLTTVFEERQGAADLVKDSNANLTMGGFKSHCPPVEQLIKPPEGFIDNNYATDSGSQQFTGMSSTGSNHSLTSITTTDSVLDFHRHTGTSFRFSYAQPTAYENGKSRTNSSLPPRMPSTEPPKIPNINGSTCITNGRFDNCDYKAPTPAKRSASSCDDPTAEYGAIDCSHNDGDTTLLSDTSTLNGDSSNLIHINKCAELERTVESLKNKLISKEKELTDLQLKQWSSDYLIDQLRSTISRLEKENAQLKNNVMLNVNSVNL